MSGSFAKLIRNLRTGAAERISRFLRGQVDAEHEREFKARARIDRAKLDGILRGSEIVIPKVHPDEAEQRVREMMVGEICDLRVAFQVAQARARGQGSMLHIEHICLSADCPHDYMLRLPGPLTREAAERDAEIKAAVDRQWFWRS